MEGALQALVDREEIRETILRWSRSVDRFDWDALDTVWTHDLRSDFTGLGLPACGAAELKELLRESEKFFSLYQHVLSNLTFHEVTRDTARTSIMVSSNNRTTEGDMFQVNGWYHDELRRTNEGWRISRRDFELLFNTSDTAGTTPMDNNARL